MGEGCPVSVKEVLIVSAARTPIGKFGMSLKDVEPQELGRIVVEEVIKRAGVNKDEIEEVIFGNVLQAGLGQNPARQVSIRAGLPYEVNAFTVNKVCGSGLKAVALGAQAIMLGEYDMVIAGGMESMSQAPYLIRNARWGYKFGDQKMVDSMIYDGIWDVYYDFHMGMTGEIIAEKYGVSREEADEFSYWSHMKAVRAWKKGLFKKEVVPVRTEKGELEKDEGPRPDTSIEKLSKLKPVFKKDGILTAGNSSQLSDGAAALILSSREKAKELGLEPMAKIIGFSSASVDPKYVMEAPIPATKKLLNKLGMKISDMDLVEHNEAFSTASIVVSRELGIPKEKFNVHGGAVALGHPIGCSGARILVTLLYALEQMDLRRGLATLCLGGGGAVAMVIEREV